VLRLIGSLRSPSHVSQYEIKPFPRVSLTYLIKTLQPNFHFPQYTESAAVRLDWDLTVFFFPPSFWISICSSRTINLKSVACAISLRAFSRLLWHYDAITHCYLLCVWGNKSHFYQKHTFLVKFSPSSTFGNFSLSTHYITVQIQWGNNAMKMKI